MNCSNNLLCYLCGEAFCENNKPTADHVPPDFIFLDSVRSKINFDQLMTLPTHEKCNKSFEKDEEFFRDNLAPLIGGTKIGDALWKDIGLSHQRRNSTCYSKMIASCMNPETGEVRSDRKRINNVLWKIARGLFYKHHQKLIASNTYHEALIVPERVIPQSDWNILLNSPSLGIYPAFFDYKICMPIDSPETVAIPMLFWGKLTGLVVFDYTNE